MFVRSVPMMPPSAISALPLGGYSGRRSGWRCPTGRTGGSRPASPCRRGVWSVLDQELDRRLAVVGDLDALTCRSACRRLDRVAVTIWPALTNFAVTLVAPRRRPNSTIAHERQAAMTAARAATRPIPLTIPSLSLLSLPWPERRGPRGSPDRNLQFVATRTVGVGRGRVKGVKPCPSRPGHVPVRPRNARRAWRSNRARVPERRRRPEASPP